MTREKFLAALNKPRQTARVGGGGSRGSEDQVQTILIEKRDEGPVKLDINKGVWSRA